MNVNIEFEKLKQTILAAAQLHGLSREYLKKNWAIDYTLELSEEFNEMVGDLNEEIKLLSQAVEKQDSLAAKSAIVGAKVYAHNLMNFFENINDDFMNLGWGDELKDKWPNIPEGYKVPEHYDYEDTNKPFSQQIVHRS